MITAEASRTDLAHYKESDWIPAIISVKRRLASMKDVTVDLIHTDLETIKRLKILENTETPGLGGRITESWFQDQFRGKKLIPELKIVPYRRAEGPNEVDAITGATQTSSAFERIINSNIRILYREIAPIE